MHNRSIMYSPFILVFIGILITVTGFLFKMAGFPETNIVVIYILAVLLAAHFTSGFIYGIGLSYIYALLNSSLFLQEMIKSAEKRLSVS